MLRLKHLALSWKSYWFVEYNWFSWARKTYRDHKSLDWCLEMNSTCLFRSYIFRYSSKLDFQNYLPMEWNLCRNVRITILFHSNVNYPTNNGVVMRMFKYKRVKYVTSLEETRLNLFPNIKSIWTPQNIFTLTCEFSNFGLLPRDDQMLIQTSVEVLIEWFGV